MNCKKLEYSFNSMDYEYVVKQAQSGDKEAKLILIQQYMPYIKKLARSYKITGYSYQDLTQLGALAVLRAIHKYKLGSNTFRGYVLRAIKNGFAQAGRDGKKRSFYRDYIAGKDNASITIASKVYYYGMLNSVHSLEDKFIEKEEIRQLKCGILRLAPGAKRFIAMLFFKNLSLKQIAKQELISYNQAIRSVNDKIKMYKKEKIKMYKVVHSCYLYLRRDSNGRQLKSTTKYNKSHGIKT